jgi:outer membrane protein assembly factor BamB
VIYVGGTDCYMYALNPNGTQKWAYRAFGRITTPAAIGRDGAVYFASADNTLYALNPNGTVRWTKSTRDVVYSAPVSEMDGQLIYGTPTGHLVAVRVDDGSTIWDRAAGSTIYTSPALGFDGSIFTLDSQGQLAKFAGPANPEPSSLIALAGGLLFTVALARRRAGRRRQA